MKKEYLAVLTALVPIVAALIGITPSLINILSSNDPVSSTKASPIPKDNPDSLHNKLAFYHVSTSAVLQPINRPEYEKVRFFLEKLNWIREHSKLNHKKLLRIDKAEKMVLKLVDDLKEPDYIREKGEALLQKILKKKTKPKEPESPIK